MTNRRSLPRWSAERRRYKPVRASLWWPLLVIPAMVYFVAAQTGYEASGKPISPANAAAVPSKGTQSATAAPLPKPLSGILRGRAITCFTHPQLTLCYELTMERL